jgi:hypothetical protein
MFFNNLPTALVGLPIQNPPKTSNDRKVFAVRFKRFLSFVFLLE